MPPLANWTDWLSYAMAAVYALVWLAMLTGRWERLGADYSQALKTAKTEKSTWLRGNIRRLARKWFIWSGPFLAVTCLFVPAWLAVQLPLLHSFAVSLLARMPYRRWARQYDLWQQLGYDGPPALEAQEKELQARLSSQTQTT